MTSLKINRILFPTDFSETANKAIPLALDIAKRSGARLTLMHIIEEPYEFAPLAEEVKHGISRKVESLFQDQLEEIRKDERYSDVQINIEIKNGHPSYAILNESDVAGADLIIMGTTGASGIEKILVGSTTTAIIMHSDIPVLAVPKDFDYDRYNGLDPITFLTDYNDGDLEALKSTVNFAQLFNADLTVLHIGKKPNLKEKVMKQGFKELASHHISYESLQFELFIQKNLNEGIADYLNMQRSSMFVMIRYKKSFFARIFTKDHLKEAGFYTKMPLLVLNGNDIS